MTLLTRFTLLVACVALAAPWAGTFKTHAQAQAQRYKVGIVADFELTDNLQAVVNTMVAEIDQLTGPARNVSLGAGFYGINTLEKAQEAYAQQKPQADMVITLGSVSTKGIALLEDLAVPVIGLGIIDPVFQEIPYSKGTSGKKNFSYIWQTRDLEKELQAFNRLYAFKNLAVFVDERAQPTVSAAKVKNLTDSLSRQYKANVTLVPVGNNVNEAVSKLPAGTDAAYFTVMFSQTNQQLQQLVAELNKRKLPTFAGNARLIDYGVLGSMANENDLAQVIRKLAIMVDGVSTGDALATMPVALDTKENFYVNVATARAIDLSIPFEVLFTANLIGDDEASAGRVTTYSFEEITEKALAANLNIQISYQDIALRAIDVQTVRANLLPSFTAGLTGSQINPERASAAFNSPERSLSGDITLSQLIYSEQAIAGLKITQYLQKAQEYNTEAEVLGVLLDTYTAYLNVLSAKTNVLIQRENLQNTRKNKELAGIRVSLGSSNNADLYRWESELAQANQSVIEAQTGLLAAKLQLNTFLANTLEPEFDVADVALDDELYAAFNEGALADIIKTPKTLQLASDFLVEESLNQNPNKKALLENVNATNRLLQQNQRLLYTPSVGLQANVSQVLARGGIGAEIDAQAMALGITELQDNSWFAGVSLSYPIFNGLGRRAAIQEAQVSLEQLGNNQTLLDQNLELGVRAGTLNLLSAGTNIQFSRASAESARQNFELVQENYKQGQVTITQLIDAQQAAVQTQLAAAISVYQYIQTHLQLEYNVGFFTLLLPEEQLQDFTYRLEAYLNSKD